MATKRLSDGSSIKNSYKMGRGATSAAKPEAPTIGAATTVNDTSATVAYTAATLGALASTFTATSTPSSLTGTGASPITVSGLTGSTNYTFTVKASNANGDSPASAASNQITTNVSLGTRGLTAGGFFFATSTVDTKIDYITIASLGNSSTFGDLTVARQNASGTGTNTRGIFCGGRPGNSNVIDYVTIASTGNATDFGDLTTSPLGPQSLSNGHGGLN